MVDVLTIAIDIGTCSAYLGYAKNERFEIIKTEAGVSEIPCYIRFTETHAIFGDLARMLSTSNAKNTIYSFMRLLGMRMQDEVVKNMQSNVPFKILENKGKLGIQVSCKSVKDKFLYVEDLVAMFIIHLMKIAQTHFKCDSINAVAFAVPASFNTNQRQGLLNAGKIAGFSEMWLVNAPIAATVAYVDANNITEPGNILMLIFGGGFLDVSIVSVNGSKFRTEITASDFIGGEDFNNILLNLCLEARPSVTHLNTKERMRTACIKVKQIIGSMSNVAINGNVWGSDEDFNVCLTRAKIDRKFEIIQNRVEKVFKIVQRKGFLLKEIVLVGGSSRLPFVEKLLSKHFPNVAVKKSINAHEAVIQGVLLIANKYMNNSNIQLADKLPQLISIRDNILMPPNSNFPIEQSVIVTKDGRIRQDTQEIVSFVSAGKFKLRINENGLVSLHSKNNHHTAIQMTENALNGSELAKRREVLKRIEDAEEGETKRLVARETLFKHAIRIVNQVSDIERPQIECILKWLEDNPTELLVAYKEKLEILLIGFPHCY